MSYEPTYSEALHLYEVQTRIRNKYGRKVVRDGKWVKWDGFTTPERQMRALSERGKGPADLDGTARGGQTSPGCSPRSESAKP